MTTQLNSGETLLFIGDSITDCGRKEPNFSPRGCGYVHMINDMLTLREPQKKITVLNRGISGDTVNELTDRWHDDVLEIKPDWLSVKVGINDIHWALGETVDLKPKKFEKLYDALLARTVEQLPHCKLLLISPFFMSRDRSGSARRAEVLAIIPEYIEVVKRLSQKYNTRFVPTHDLFQEQLKYHKLEVFSTEPVHPNSAGHRLIADAVYAALSQP